MSSSKKSDRGTSVANDFNQALHETPAFESMRYTANYIRMAKAELSASEYQNLMAGFEEAGKLLPENFNPAAGLWPPEAEDISRRMEDMLKNYDELAGCFKVLVQSARAASMLLKRQQ
ncbi:uncharacterized protein BKA55DRAFT_559162 [Fusarium redolens]|uniref:Uncharacterized protein n=1 Tax=Fusarium redolens TaxID=48865 RepID=A0A9P9HXV6_FUSRE|nr:uncharacterized protein BKA55DRAFT_559162 [Fusarium redolens]KAH7265535.1 hypothetical protein BKA55DRAFT_559162 [Fusarium redolens]